MSLNARTHNACTQEQAPADALTALGPLAPLFRLVYNGRHSMRAYYVASLLWAVQNGRTVADAAVQRAAWWAQAMAPHVAQGCNGACFTRGNALAKWAKDAGITLKGGKVQATPDALARCAYLAIPRTPSDAQAMLATVGLAQDAAGMPVTYYRHLSETGNVPAVFTGDGTPATDAHHGASLPLPAGYVAK